MDRSITIAELIQDLQKLPQDWRVFIEIGGSLMAENPQNPKENTFIDLEKIRNG